MSVSKISLSEIIGKTFGRLTVVESYRINGRVYVKATCTCNGNVKEYDYCSLKTGHTQSCGCLRRETISKTKSIHHGKGTRLYNIWKNMRQRCLNPKHPEYKYYGGNNIMICSEWDDFTKFRTWALNNGYAETLTIERINLNEGYNPINCKWILKGQQSSNKRDTVLMTINGISKPFTIWCKEYGIAYKTVKKRMSKGMDFQTALTAPKQTHKKNNALGVLQ